MSHQVRLGNVAPVSVTHTSEDDPTLKRSEVELPGSGESVTEIEVPDDASLAEAFTAITAPGGVWDYHSDADATWVSSTHPGLADLLAQHFGCEKRKHDTKVVTVLGAADVATPKAHREQLAGHASRLGAKADDASE